MRLNCVESFYMLLLHFRSKGSEKRGWPTTAWPPVRGQPATAKASSQGAVDASGLQAVARKGCRLSLVGAALACRGAAPVEVPLVGAEPTAGVAAPWSSDYRLARQPSPAQGQRRRSEGKGRGLGHPFEKRTILPL
ncbi:hypothetical protein B296_00026671 [Ensete ventricosum]|uniref:Uncharacterized protein n=1 Tax=Ensete ventricosum TaxID=4639 RepID=A0A426XXF3_ENSVE|nr:hypothetical protein B296_00026671 [Ensete ventricosum]